MSRLHGVKTIELDNGTAMIRTVSTAIIGLVGTAPDAATGTVATGRTGSALTDNELLFSAKAAGVYGNKITLVAVSGKPGESLGLATATAESAAWEEVSRTLTITLGCDAAGAIVSTSKTVSDTVNALADSPVKAQGSGEGLMSAFLLTLTGGADEPFPLNVPVLVTGETQAKQLGKSGSLSPALSEIYDQEGALVIVVRIAQPAALKSAKNADPEADLRVAVLEGIKALENSREQTTYQPRIFIATGFSEDDAVAKALESTAAKLRGVAYVDSPAMATPQSVVQRRPSFGERVELLRHRIARTGSDGMIAYRPSSAAAAGLRARIDREKGWWWSKSNQAVMNITGVEQIESFSLNDENCTANLLNADEVSTMIRYDGFRHWGNRLCSKHPQRSFESVRRTADVIEDSIEEAMMPYIDRPIDTWIVDDIVGSVNSYMRSLKTLGAIHGGACWPDAELNTAESLAAGELYLNYDFGPKSPLEKLTMRVRINNNYALEELANV